MGSHPLSASERRGVIVVAILSLLIVGLGISVKMCGRPERVIEPKEVEVLLHRDSVAELRADSIVKARRDSLRREQRDSLRRVSGDSLPRERHSGDKNTGRSRKKKAPKVYRRDSPLDRPLSK